MKRLICILLIFILSISLDGCAFLNTPKTEDVSSNENAKAFYDKVSESKVLLDLVATDVCAAWKDATYDFNLSTKDVNTAIEIAKNTHSDNIVKINDLDKEILDLFDKAKYETKDYWTENAIKQVMTTYSEYKDSILNANEALDSRGYIGISSSKDSLDRALQDLFIEL